MYLKIIFLFSSLMTVFLENLKPHNQLLTSIELIRANYDLILSEIQLKDLILKMSNDSIS